MIVHTDMLQPPSPKLTFYAKLWYNVCIIGVTKKYSKRRCLHMSKYDAMGTLFGGATFAPPTEGYMNPN